LLPAGLPKVNLISSVQMRVVLHGWE
jgi:hypothetical protein